MSFLLILYLDGKKSSKFSKALKIVYLPHPLIPLSSQGEGEGEERGADVPLRRPAKLVSFTGRKGILERHKWE
jgi:hypothetical protein